VIDYVHIERSEVQESGEYDLEGLFVRLNHAIDSIGAKRVVLDTLEALFAGLPNEAILRAELRRLFRWLKDKGVTAVITAERGREQLTRHGLEEYVSDCVILLDHRVNDQIATRHLRVVKYRGALHGTNEFPFLIGDEGISVLPITSLGLNHKVSSERIATGIPRLDAMLGGRGFFRGSSILLTGTPGTGKTIVAANFAQAAAGAGSACSSSRSRNRPTRSSATCIPSGCAWSRWSSAACCGFTRRGPRSTAWKCTWPRCSRRSPRFNPTSSSWTRLPA
jgi:circadian clock protein KaiC